MAAPLSLASATVTDEAGHAVATKAQVLVRENVLSMRSGGTSDDRPGVQSVTQVSRGVWRIRFPDSTELTVTRQGGCGCGGRRR